MDFRPSGAHGGGTGEVKRPFGAFFWRALLIGPVAVALGWMFLVYLAGAR